MAGLGRARHCEHRACRRQGQQTCSLVLSTLYQQSRASCNRHASFICHEADMVFLQPTRTAWGSTPRGAAAATHATCFDPQTNNWLVMCCINPATAAVHMLPDRCSCTAVHHTITTALCCLRWCKRICGTCSAMRPEANITLFVVACSDIRVCPVLVRPGGRCALAWPYLLPR